jgi:hypothetical protein
MLGTAPLTTIGNGLGARMSVAADPITGLSLRAHVVRRQREGEGRLDALYGVKTLDCNLAVRSYDA